MAALREKEMYIVLIEADGARMPSTYYRRRESLAMKVRGDRELGPLARRENGTSVIFQEGAVLCNSYSLARQMAWLAIDAFDELERNGELEGREPCVSIGRASLTDNITRTSQDSQVINRIQEVLGKRGRKPEPGRWVVACKECCRIADIEHHNPIQCPHCSGFLIHKRKGQPVIFRDPGGDVLELWQRTRFANGLHWEPAGISDYGDIPPALDQVEVHKDRDREVIGLMSISPALETIRRMDRETALLFLDAIFCNRTSVPRDERLNNRLQAATMYLRKGGDATAIELAEPDVPDLFDASAVVPAGTIAAWAITN